MSHQTLEQVFREASGHIVAALAARFRNLDLCEDAFGEACVRAATAWLRTGPPEDPRSWLYCVARRCAIDRLRQQRTQEKYTPLLLSEDAMEEPDSEEIPDERLRLIFVCCHPAIAAESRAALTLKLVCGLSTREIAQAFLVSEATMGQRFVRAKRKIAESGISFEVPGANAWPERLAAVLSTLDVAYSKAHEAAACDGSHANFATEMLELTKTLAFLIPCDADVLALAATVRFAEARRPARVRDDSSMCPLAEQDPHKWRRDLIDEAHAYLQRSLRAGRASFRVVQAQIQAVWCSRASLQDPPPWSEVLSLYDELIAIRDDPFVRINRAVVIAEVAGPQAALAEIDSLDGTRLQGYGPFHAVRADVLRRLHRASEALQEYTAALECIHTSAERTWLMQQMHRLSEGTASSI